MLKWRSVPSSLNSQKQLERALAWLELYRFVDNHEGGAWRPLTIVSLLEHIRTERDSLLHEMRDTANQTVGKQEIFSPTDWGLTILEDRNVHPYIVLLSDSSPAQSRQREHVCFVRWPQYGWEPMASNEEGQMATLISDAQTQPSVADMLRQLRKARNQNASYSRQPVGS